MSGKPRRFVDSLKDAEKEMLRHHGNHHGRTRIRRRAHAILSYAANRFIDEIVDIFGHVESVLDTVVRVCDDSSARREMSTSACKLSAEKFDSELVYGQMIRHLELLIRKPKR